MDAVDERRRDNRRMLPFGRSAVLEVDGRNHIVSLVDLSRGGAYLGTRLRPEGGALFLKLLLPQGGAEMRLRCSIVRRIEADPDADQIPGLAVSFSDLGDELVARLEAFVVAGGFGEAQD